ncbi:redox-sensing transcriptional repressor Rex [Streptobacillus moniliformis]|uniref:Redox-sensing transcriptional repressor Rex n=1 Tax=Streptobacillus moniliformis (strain ATCC 14647 / DSM 12112 / NCTC 10651 / 9901) TaxID=519441 RepID=D1AX32_STRM9|nr:redox-sensing transcriptional repressor Rex [Streptobacillus moniliformis]ACZ00858.1 CoA-binding domain protein [Streptobacillus moniliformis DSM 12112]AVL42752.1 redox-sensing transcriptional repressor Rex [Streptobacillus moniliformis]SQA14007.1 Redox-sensing transcriptional repressor rex [Streptobacillus moniliformis]
MTKKYSAREISGRIISRLTLYLSILKDLERIKPEVNSVELSKKMNTTAVQVRKDLSTFGEFGVRGKGYNISALIKEIESILGIDKENEVILLGYGNVGTMIARNTDVLGKGFKVTAIFDIDPNKIGQEIPNLDIKVSDANECINYIKENKVHTVILAINSEFAQTVADELIEAGIQAILNMTDYKLELNTNTAVVNADISAKLKELNFWRINPELRGGINFD